MHKADFAEMFKESVKTYLDAARPCLNDNLTFQIREAELQAFYMCRLIDRKIHVRAHPQYEETIMNRRADILAGESQREVLIEIEWSARWRDGFAKRTFDDLEKLSLAKKGQKCLFLALNISDKIVPPEAETEIADPYLLPTKGDRSSALRKYWKNAPKGSLIRCSPRLWYWPYTYQKDGKFTVSVLTCYGRKLRGDSFGPVVD